VELVPKAYLEGVEEGAKWITYAVQSFWVNRVRIPDGVQVVFLDRLDSGVKSAKLGDDGSHRVLELQTTSDLVARGDIRKGVYLVGGFRAGIPALIVRVEGVKDHSDSTATLWVKDVPANEVFQGAWYVDKVLTPSPESVPIQGQARGTFDLHFPDGRHIRVVRQAPAVLLPALELRTDWEERLRAEICFPLWPKNRNKCEPIGRERGAYADLRITLTFKPRVQLFFDTGIPFMSGPWGEISFYNGVEVQAKLEGMVDMVVDLKGLEIEFPKIPAASLPIPIPNLLSIVPKAKIGGMIGLKEALFDFSVGAEIISESSFDLQFDTNNSSTPFQLSTGSTGKFRPIFKADLSFPFLKEGRLDLGLIEPGLPLCLVLEFVNLFKPEFCLEFSVEGDLYIERQTTGHYVCLKPEPSINLTLEMEIPFDKKRERKPLVGD
jgi:hypothetical protein